MTLIAACSILQTLEMHLQFLKNLRLTEFKRPPKPPSKKGSKDDAVSLVKSHLQRLSVLFFSAHTGLISVGSTTPTVSLLGILIPRRSPLHSNHKSFLVILGNFTFNQLALLVLK